MDARPAYNDPQANVAEALPLAMSDIRFAVDGQPILKGVSLAVRPREVLCLLGPSGCGKTTLLRIAAGIERQTAGVVSVAGDIVADDRRYVPAEKRHLGYVFQDLALFPHMRVDRNVTYGLRRQGASAETVRAALAQVGLSGRERAYPHELSGGEQQRVALVRALLPAPKVVLFDEPFSGLDRGLRDTVRHDVLNVLKEREATAVIVTHDPEEALAMADSIALMREGRVVQVASPDEIWRWPVDLAAARVFSRVNVFTTRAQGGVAETPVGRIPVPVNRDGERLTIAFRPNAIRVYPADHRGGTLAKVLRRRFHGTHVELSTVVGGVTVDVRAEPYAVPHGEDVRLHADLRQAIVLPAASGSQDRPDADA